MKKIVSLTCLIFLVLFLVFCDINQNEEAIVIEYADSTKKEVKLYPSYDDKTISIFSMNS